MSQEAFCTIQFWNQRFLYSRNLKISLRNVERYCKSSIARSSLFLRTNYFHLQITYFVSIKKYNQMMFVIALLTCCASVRGNILDNMFANFQAPPVNLPPDFHVIFGLSKTESPTLLEVNYSTKFKAAHIVWMSNLQNFKVVLANVYVNISTNEIFVHNLRQSCQVLEGPSYVQKINSQAGNGGGFIVEPEVVFRLMSLYIATGDDDLSRYEITALMSGRNKAYALFDKRGDLEQLEFVVEGQVFKAYVVDKMTKKQFAEEDFKVPSSWKCSSSSPKIKITQIEELFQKIFNPNP